MKKILSMVLMIFTIISVTAYAHSSDDITRAQAAGKIVQYMYDLSYGEPFPLDMTYCMHEKRSMHFTAPITEQGEEGTYPLLASVYHSMGWNGFSDVAYEHENAIKLNLAKEMGIIDGNGDGTFCPDEAATFGQCVKMLVCALGYTDRAVLDGGYPNGYIKVADEIGITENIKLDLDSFVSVQQFETMLTDGFALDGYPIKNMLINMPVTAEEAVRVYSEGIKNRDARVQYAVFGDELQRNNKEHFEELHWVTGVSSPWCTGYEAEKINDLEYSVIFSYATSAGPAGDERVKITAEKFGPVYKITAVENAV